MSVNDGKTQQLRVRISGEERDQLERLLALRQRGETISDLVREAISLLLQNSSDGAGEGGAALSPRARAHVERLAVLLKRESLQVEEACIEGIVDLVDGKCEVPLIVMESHLHQKYRSREERPVASNLAG